MWETTPASGTRPSSESDARRAQLVSEGEAAWAGRSDEPNVRMTIERWRVALEIDPRDHVLWARLARSYYFLADGHLSFDDAREEEMMATFELGIQAAEHALMAISADFAERVTAGTRVEEAAMVVEADAVPALYWRSTSMGKWALARGLDAVLAYKDEVRAIMTRCLELDANYFHGGPHRYFGVFFARLPTFAGGNLEQSREHFVQALRAENDYFGTHTLYAEYYAVGARDRALFEEQLRWVTAANPNVLSDEAPENRVEQRRAQQLLAQTGDLFE